MKRNDIKALASKSLSELQAQLRTIVVELSTARLEKKAGKSANPRVVSNLSDDVARIKTVMRDKELAKES